MTVTDRYQPLRTVTDHYVPQVLPSTTDETLELSLRQPHDANEPFRASLRAPNAEACQRLTSAIQRALRAQAAIDHAPRDVDAFDDGDMAGDNGLAEPWNYASNYAGSSRGRGSWSRFALPAVPSHLRWKLRMAMQRASFVWD